jgi:hypothetical protein
VIACSDYDEIKKELEILKFIEFSSELETTNDGAAKSRDKNAPRFGESMTLEQLLVSKNKRLQSEITSFKVCCHSFETVFFLELNKDENFARFVLKMFLNNLKARLREMKYLVVSLRNNDASSPN